MSITQWPKEKRPREKLLQKGASALTDAELLAIFLRTGTKGVDAVELSYQLLEQFGSLQALLHASEKEFCQGLGLGQAKYVQLQAVLEMARRYLNEAVASQTLNSPEATKAFIQAHLVHQQREVFACLFLNNQLELIQYEELFFGSINQANVHPREVVKLALQYNAAAVTFAHNHPSGHCQPSTSDIDITKRLQQALEIVDIRVIDHIVVGKGQCASMRELNLF